MLKAMDGLKYVKPLLHNRRQNKSIKQKCDRTALPQIEDEAGIVILTFSSKPQYCSWDHIAHFCDPGVIYIRLSMYHVVARIEMLAKNGFS